MEILILIFALWEPVDECVPDDEYECIVVETDIA